MGAECSKPRQPMRAVAIASCYEITCIKRRQGVTSHCPISKIPGPSNSAHRALQVEGCAPKNLKKGRTLVQKELFTRAFVTKVENVLTMPDFGKIYKLFVLEFIL